MRDQIADEARRGFEFLAGHGGRRVHQVVAEHIPVDPGLLLAVESQSLQTAIQCGVCAGLGPGMVSGCHNSEENGREGRELRPAWPMLGQASRFRTGSLIGQRRCSARSSDAGERHKVDLPGMA